MKNHCVIHFVGPDGCGKSTLARMTLEILKERGHFVELGWSRFNNYLSKPLLVLARLTGHNYYEVCDGVRFGYHDFENSILLKYTFILFQAIDVNIAFAIRFHKLRYKASAIIFDRGPWDTLADVILDTGNNLLLQNLAGKCFIRQVCRHRVFFVQREMSRVLESRQELKHDRKLERKHSIYAHMSEYFNWEKINNNDSLDEVRTALSARI